MFNDEGPKGASVLSARSQRSIFVSDIVIHSRPI
jgi:hypothetical protein